MFKAVWLLCKREMITDVGFRKWWTKQVYSFARDQLLQETREARKREDLTITCQIILHHCFCAIHRDVTKFRPEDNDLQIILRHIPYIHKWEFYWK